MILLLSPSVADEEIFGARTSRRLIRLLVNDLRDARFMLEDRGGCLQGFTFDFFHVDVLLAVEELLMRPVLCN
tara:strand:- start:498 stop:716 length:219 start_codon:yes stop_codon:yes gene_type:complete